MVVVVVMMVAVVAFNVGVDGATVALVLVAVAVVAVWWCLYTRTHTMSHAFSNSRS